MHTPALLESLDNILSPAGFESHPFKIGWYNEVVMPYFKLDYPEDTLAIIVISTPAMFDKGFKPYICKVDCLGPKDPIDECVSHHFDLIKQAHPEHDIECIADYERHHNHRPKVLVQTAGHVAGAAYYYQRKDVVNDPWDKKKKICGVSLHPKYGGWFALRGMIIFKDVFVPELPWRPPLDVLRTDEAKINLLQMFNYSGRDWGFRDVIETQDKYSEEQKLYFSTPPKQRMPIIEQIRAQR